MPRIATPIEFWDSSSLVKILLPEIGSNEAQDAFAKASNIALWWGTSCEIVSTIERRRRTSESPPEEADTARADLAELLRNQVFTIIAPSPQILELSYQLLSRNHLRAADSLQLASALLLRQNSYGVTFRTEDRRLGVAAESEGLHVPSPFNA